MIGTGSPAIRTFRASDGARLRYQSFEHEHPEAVLVYLHGIESHGGWFHLCAAELRRRAMTVHLLDRRGSGLNRADAGFPDGHAGSFRILVDDVLAFAATLPRPGPPIHLIGLSWGGKLAVASALARPGFFRSLILVTPGLRARVDLPLRDKLRVALGVAFRPRLPVAIPIEAEMFTRTPEPLAAIRSDPLRLHRATARFFLESRRLDRHIDRHIGDLALPILLVLADREEIIDNAGVLALLKRARAPLTLREYGGLGHSVQFEAPDRLAEDIAAHVRSLPS